MGMGEAGLGGLSEWVGLFHVDSRISEKKQNRMILIVKDFLLTPLSTIFLLCQIKLDGYPKQKKRKTLTSNSSRTM